MTNSGVPTVTAVPAVTWRSKMLPAIGARTTSWSRSDPMAASSAESP